MKRTPLAALLLAAVLGGCSAAGAPLPVTGDREFDTVWDAARNVLADNFFRIDRLDARAGVITTYPMVGRHWFEFWRQDAPTPRLAAMNTLHQIRQTVTVTVSKVEDADADRPGRLDKYAVRVRVEMARSTRPTYQINSTADAYQMFLGSRLVHREPAVDEGAGPAAPSAEPIGRNEPFEAALTKEILSRAAKNLTVYRAKG